MLATEASEEAAAAAAAREPTTASPPSEEWIASADVDSRGTYSSRSASSSNIDSPSSGRSGSGRSAPVDGDVDSVDYAFMAMERRSLEASWK